VRVTLAGHPSRASDGRSSDRGLSGSCSMDKLPFSVIIPTRNEERNIRAAIESVADWADGVFVLDSLSTDRTVKLAREMGAKVSQRRFDNFAGQKNWALDNLPLASEWVLFLDADERVPPELRREIIDAVRDAECPFDGFYVGRQNYFMGVPARHGGWYPDRRLVLFKHRLGRYEDRIVHEHMVLNGRVGLLKHPLLHYNDNKGLHQYFDRHNVYSTMEALEAHRHLTGSPSVGTLRATFFGAAPERRRALKQWAYRNLPCRPLFKFLWSYLLKRGFLDGRVGFRFCLLQSFYEYQVSLKLIELRSDPTSPMLRYTSAPALDTTAEDEARAKLACEGEADPQP
jgi:glycosyltransferase involved in cell wall biosynthesis